MLVSRGKHSKARRGGTIVNVLTAVVFFGLIGAGLWWIIKTAGQAGQQYSEAMIDTTDKATTLACQANLRTIGQNLQMYAISNDEFPGSQEELVRWGGSTRLFRCPDPNGGTYVYVPGLGRGAPATSVVVYEPNAVHDGRCNVLFLNGQIAALVPEQLKQALEATLTAR
jgi:hypothetical protein